MTTVRAAFHVHSEWSYDAEIPLPEIAELFRTRNCDAVFMCEHDRGFDAERFAAYVEACREASVEGGPLLVPGIEYASPDDRVHVPVWGPVPFLGEGVPTTELLRAVDAHGGAAVLAHPVRRDAWRVFDPEWLALSAGIEIWTRKWDGWAPNPRACRMAAEAGLVGVGALDLHRAHQLFPLTMELQVENTPQGALDGPPQRPFEHRLEGPLENPLTAEACVEAFRQGRCRAMIGERPVAPLTRGGLGATAIAVESVRRPVWRQGRRLRERKQARR
ncbi:MAG: PHP domain-containing protein [Solirubrobacteraceae bacterium]